MTAKEFVKQYNPSTIITQYKRRGCLDKHIYFIVKDIDLRLNLGEGNSKSAAWVDAKNYIIESKISQFFSENKASKEIAKILHISKKSVEKIILELGLTQNPL
jgi:hypothetical protein